MVSRIETITENTILTPRRKISNYHYTDGVPADREFRKCGVKFHILKNFLKTKRRFQMVASRIIMLCVIL